MTTLTIPNLIVPSIIANAYAANNNAGASSPASPTLSNLNKTVTVTLGPLTPIGSGVGTGTTAVRIVPAASLTDSAGNSAAPTERTVTPLF